MAKEPITNKYASKITHDGVEMTWNAESKSVLNAEEANDFYKESFAAVGKFKKGLQPKKGLSPLTKAFFFMIVAALAMVAVSQVSSQLFCHERWCW